MSNIFEGDADSDVEIRTHNEYARSYNIWRKKEEINKLQTKYGDEINFNEDSSSSSDDEEGIELTEEFERDFFKTLAYLKNKDPRIYNENVNFFQDKDENISSLKGKKKKKKDAPMYLKDYERKIILEKDGILSDEENYSENKLKSVPYVEEQDHIKESLKSALDAVDNDDGEANEEWGGLFKERKKTEEEKEEEDSVYKKWLAGEQKNIDKDTEMELKPLKDYWNNPDLDQGEKFLRDYILNKKFLDKGNEDYIPMYEEIIHDSDKDLSNDEETVEKQEEFEQKYNFRFEEPDQEFIKRYPRTIENSVRKKDDKRPLKRQETKERKKREKQEKIQELKKLQEFKRKEIEEKLEKLKEITGDSDIGFADEDIDGDFDPEAHDKRMQALFNDEYYQELEEQQKPVFPDLDEELEIENWDRYEVENEDKTPHCEDDNFNMNCDYDPNQSTQNELIERSKGKKKRKRKSKVAEALSKPKPKFDPADKNYEKYFDEYYKLDCEDIIGDIPCRFKYREVVPNDFGLTTEEILLAKERELNKWCSLKKAVQIRPDNVEKYEQIAYKKKGQNINLKKNILPSLFMPDPEENKDIEIKKVINVSSGNAGNLIDKQNKNGNLPKDKQRNILINHESEKTIIKKKKKNKHTKNSTLPPAVDNGNDATKGDNDKMNSNSGNHENIESQNVDAEKNKLQIRTKKKSDIGMLNNQKCGRKRKRSGNRKESEVPRKKINNRKQNANIKELAISDERLSAYGINPKKFKNKLKYGNK